LRDSQGQISETIAAMVVRRQTIPKQSHTGGEVAHRFLRDSSLDHLVVLDDDRPLGLITRQQFNLKTAGPVGFSLHQNNPAEMVAMPIPLLVEEQDGVTALARLAMDRPQQELYEPVVVTTK